MIELSHVTKTFGGATRALDDLTLTVPQGAVYGLVGSNGAGKTTAIRHITGIFRQDSGFSAKRINSCGKCTKTAGKRTGTVKGCTGCRPICRQGY